MRRERRLTLTLTLTRTLTLIGYIRVLCRPNSAARIPRELRLDSMRA